MAAGELKDSTNSAETNDELAELVEDEVEHEAPVRSIRRPKCALDPVGDLCAELEVGVENCKYVSINLERKVQESKQTRVKVNQLVEKLKY